MQDAFITTDKEGQTQEVQLSLRFKQEGLSQERAARCGLEWHDLLVVGLFRPICLRITERDLASRLCKSISCLVERYGIHRILSGTTLQLFMVLFISSLIRTSSPLVLAGQFPCISRKPLRFHILVKP